MTKDRTTGLIALVLGIAVAIATSQLPPSTMVNDIGPKVFPFISAGLLIICGAGLLLTGTKKEEKAAYTKPAQIQDYYDEYTDSVVGGPDDPDSSYTSPDTTYTEPVQDTTTVQEPVTDPVPPVTDTSGTENVDTGTVTDPGLDSSGTPSSDPSTDAGTDQSGTDAMQ